MDYQNQDITCLAPLWAELLTPSRAEALVRNTILDEKRFCRPCGVPLRLTLPENPDAEASSQISLFWNLLVGEGLLAYGYTHEAAELVHGHDRAVFLPDRE